MIEYNPPKIKEVKDISYRAMYRYQDRLKYRRRYWEILQKKLQQKRRKLSKEKNIESGR